MNLSEFAQDGSILTEINMSPSSLKQLASQISATVGIEFEMIVKDAITTTSRYDGGEMEPDYDEDTRTDDIDSIIDFFNDNDYNGRGDIRNLERSLREDYQEWFDEQIDDAWGGEQRSYVRDWIAENVSRSDIVDALGIDPEDDLGVTKTQMQELAERVVEEGSDNPWYESAYDQFREEQQEEGDYSENRWLRRSDLFYMSHIESRYSISWPYWIHSGGEDEEAVEGDRIANDFAGAVGRRAKYYGNYHGGSRSSQASQGFYIIEPDGSLNAQDDTDKGLEFVSPPMSLNDMLKEMPQVIAWAKSNDNYTTVGTGCGLHMNVSIDGTNQETQLDYVKLALLLGDNHVLQEFGRVGNHYCKSALDKVRAYAKMMDANRMEQVLNGMRGGLSKLASNIVHNGSTDKFVSINNKGKYIEFRSPGGDWLEEDFSKLSNTLLRFVVALDAAMDPAKYRDEYAKKLYKLLAPSEDSTNTIKYFSEFSAGKLPRSALVSFVRQARLKRKGVDSTEGMPMWLVTTRKGDQTFVKAADEAGAIEAARHKLGLADPMSRSLYSDNSFEVQQRQSRGPVPAPVASSTQDVQQNRPQSVTGNWKIVAIPADGDPQIIHVLMDIGPNQSDANRAAADWIQANRDSVADLIRGAEITVLPSRV